MELEEMSHRIAYQAKELQLQIKALRLVKASWDLTRPNCSIESTLGRIEERLIRVYSNTDTLVGRVPENLKPLLLGIKSAVLERIDSLKTASTQSHKSNESVRADTNWLKSGIKKLTPQERRLFQICFQCGLITYRELAEQLDISPTSVKNIVNRLFKNPEKCRLFHKKHIHGVAKVGVAQPL